LSSRRLFEWLEDDFFEWLPLRLEDDFFERLPLRLRLWLPLQDELE